MPDGNTEEDEKGCEDYAYNDDGKLNRFHEAGNTMILIYKCILKIRIFYREFVSFVLIRILVSWLT